MIRANQGILAGAIAVAAMVGVAGGAQAGGYAYDSGPAASGRTMWEGTHFGGHIGWAGADYSANPDEGALSLTNGLGDGDGFAGGFLYGASLQFDNWVLGTDSVWTFGDNGGNTATTASGLTLSTDINFMDEARGRIGYLVMPNVLAYGALGIAFADVDINGSVLAGNGDSKGFVGFTYGGGAEAMFGDRWFARVEYSHIDFGDEHIAAANGGTYKVDLDTDAVRAAVGYRFDWSPLDLLR